MGSTYGPEGITVAVRIGFDDNRSLGQRETGGRVALPVFKEIMLDVYSKKLAGPVPEFPPEMEQSISIYLNSGPVETAAAADASLAGMFKSHGLNVEASNTPAHSPCTFRERGAAVLLLEPSRALTNDDLSRESILSTCQP